MEKWEAFREDIDLILYFQMKRLISRAAKEKVKSVKFQVPIGENELFPTMEEQYQLRYPGEVLERYEERCGSELKKIRAIALALGEMNDNLEEGMFVGNQYTDFIRKVKYLSKKDFYLNAMLYMLEKTVEEKEKIYEWIVSFHYQKTQEVVFALFILHDREDAWDALGPVIILFFGKRRTLKVYGNIGLYGWFINMFYLKVKVSRRRDMDILKALAKLPFARLKEANVKWKRLEEHGYSRQEIIYANLLLPEEIMGYKVIEKDSITMERMALAACEELLNSEVIENPVLYELCRLLLCCYQRYEIKLEGETGIVESLFGKIRLRNTEMFRYLYQVKQEYELPNDWFLVDLVADSRWDGLISWMNKKEYSHIFEKSILYCQNVNVDAWILKYKCLTGWDYTELFWKGCSPDRRNVFSLMVVSKTCDLLKLLQKYAEDKESLAECELNEKWEYMKENIYSFVKELSTYEAFQFWATFDKLHGIEHLGDFLGHPDIVTEAVGIHNFNSYYKERFGNMNLKREFLSVKEQGKLVEWIERYVFMHMTQHYEEFIEELLLCDFIRKIFPEASREICDFLLEGSGKDSNTAKRLRKCYYSEAEWLEYERTEEERKAEKKRLEKKKVLQNIRTELLEALKGAGDAETLTKIREFIKGQNYSRKQDALKISVRYLQTRFQGKGISGTKSDICWFVCELISSWRYYDNFKITEVKAIYNKMEVEYESGNR